MEARNNQEALANDAFISYSRKDRDFAACLEKALEKYKPPKDLDLPRRNLVVFRDEEDFTGVEYHASLGHHLKNSRKMILICSPHARQSKFVNDEIRRFTKERGAEHIIPVLIAGLPNNEAKPDQEEEKAFPEALCEIQEMPLAASYIGYDMKRNKANKGVFYNAWYKILADLYEVSRSAIEERDRKRRARQRIIAATILLLICAIMSGLSIYTWKARRDEAKQREVAEKSAREAGKQRDLAEKRNRTALARQLAARSEILRDKDPKSLTLSVLLAVESIRRFETLEGWLALRKAVTLLPEVRISREWEVPWVNAINSLAFSRDGKYLAAGSLCDINKTAHVRVWETETGAEIFSQGFGQHVIEQHHAKKLKTTCDEQFIAFRVNNFLEMATDNDIYLWDPIRNETRSFTFESAVIQSISPDGQYLCILLDAQTDEIVRLKLDIDGPISTETIVSRPREKGLSRVKFSPNGQLLYNKGQQEIIDIQNVKGKDAGYRIPPTHGRVDNLAFSTKGDMIATLHTNADILVWKYPSGEDVGQLSPVSNTGAQEILFDPDDKVLAVSFGTVVRLWNFREEGNEIARFEERSNASALAFSPNGRYLATAGGGGVRVHLWQPQDLMNVACKHVTRNFSRAEWRQYLGDEDYYETCPGLPVPENEKSPPRAPGMFMVK